MSCLVPARRLVRRRGGGGLELLLLDLGRTGRKAARDGVAARGHPRLRPQPDRPGNRVDYCRVHAVQTFRRPRLRGGDGQLQPRDRLHDYDTSDRLYFEPLSPGEVLAGMLDREQPAAGTQFGGQTPLRLARVGSRAPATGSWARRTRRSTSPRIESGSPHSPKGSECVARPGDRRRLSEALSPRAPSATPCSSGRRTCWAGARCGSATTTTRLRPRWLRSAGLSCSTSSWRTRSRSTSTRSATATTSISPR